MTSVQSNDDRGRVVMDFVFGDSHEASTGSLRPLCVNVCRRFTAAVREIHGGLRRILDGDHQSTVDVDDLPALMSKVPGRLTIISAHCPSPESDAIEEQ